MNSSQNTRMDVRSEMKTKMMGILQDMRRLYDVFEICQPVAGKSGLSANRQPTADKSLLVTTRPRVVAESVERLRVDFTKHYHLGWTHCRILLGIGDVRQRGFCFERACAERWSKRELVNRGRRKWELTNRGGMVSIPGTSLLSVSTAGRGATSSEVALAFFRGLCGGKDAAA